MGMSYRPDPTLPIADPHYRFHLFRPDPWGGTKAAAG
jgi:hypothetical protein